MLLIFRWLLNRKCKTCHYWTITCSKVGDMNPELLGVCWVKNYGGKHG